MTTTRDSFFDNSILKDCWLTTKEAANFLRISANALRIAVCRGKVRSYKFGRRLRFKLSDLAQVPILSGS